MLPSGSLLCGLWLLLPCPLSRVALLRCSASPCVTTRRDAAARLPLRLGLDLETRTLRTSEKPKPRSSASSE